MPVSAAAAAQAVERTAGATRGAQISGPRIWAGRELGTLTATRADGSIHTIAAFASDRFQPAGLLYSDALQQARAAVVDSNGAARAALRDAVTGELHLTKVVDASGAGVRLDDATALQPLYSDLQFTTRHRDLVSLHGEEVDIVLRPEVRAETAHLEELAPTQASTTPNKPSAIETPSARTFTSQFEIDTGSLQTILRADAPLAEHGFRNGTMTLHVVTSAPKRLSLFRGAAARSEALQAARAAAMRSGQAHAVIAIDAGSVAVAPVLLDGSRFLLGGSLALHPYTDLAKDLTRMRPARDDLISIVGAHTELTPGGIGEMWRLRLHPLPPAEPVDANAFTHAPLLTVPKRLGKQTVIWALPATHLGNTLYAGASREQAIEAARSAGNAAALRLADDSFVTLRTNTFEDATLSDARLDRAAMHDHLVALAGPSYALWCDADGAIHRNLRTNHELRGR